MSAIKSNRRRKCPNCEHMGLEVRYFSPKGHETPRRYTNSDLAQCACPNCGNDWFIPLSAAMTRTFQSMYRAGVALSKAFREDA